MQPTAEAITILILMTFSFISIAVTFVLIYENRRLQNWANELVHRGLAATELNQGLLEMIEQLQAEKLFNSPNRPTPEEEPPRATIKFNDPELEPNPDPVPHSQTRKKYHKLDGDPPQWFHADNPDGPWELMD